MKRERAVRQLRSIIALILLGIVARANADFVVTMPTKPIAGDAGVTETSWRRDVAPDGPYDKIGLHRYQAASGNAKAVLFYLPGTNMNGELAVADENHNLWLYLAARGITVYALDYRTHFVPNDPVPNLAFMKDWTVGRFVDDAKLALAMVRKTERARPVFIAGFSRGVTYAYILAGQEKAAGLVALDGSFKSYDPKGFDRAGAMHQLDASGEYGSILSKARSWAGRTEMMKRAAADPNGPAMGKFPSIGAQLSSVLYYAWGPGALANPRDGISSIQVLAASMVDYDRCFPVIQNIEGRSMEMQADDPATSLDDQFGHMTVPVIYFGSTNFGPENLLNGIYSAAKAGSKDVTINVLERYGHVDVLFGDQAKDDVYRVIQRWIDTHLAG